MLRELVERAIRVKIDVVVGDLKETGGARRASAARLLNYGHTLAHAIERAEGYRMRHGDAVAIGCVYAAELAGLAGVLDAATVDRHREVLQRVGLPTTYANAGFDELLATMRVDKKARGSQIRFVALEGLGRPVVLEPDRGAAAGGLGADRRRSGMRGVVLNGPNLGRLGRRQPEIYGTTTHAELAELCAGWGQRPRARGRDPADQPRGRAARLAQRRPPTRTIAVVLNAGAWTHYSLALFDACAQLTAPLVEVHISDPKQRPEEFRHTSVVEPYAVATIAGQGIDGYRQALEVVAARRTEADRSRLRRRAATLLPHQGEGRTWRWWQQGRRG